ncbi:MAG: type IV pilus twitching motility protein PilT [Verrucomicrobia bacterium]|nr:type IV pilus twitching motility protein PilT [Verrucomicrobiota bacterium]
MAALDDFFRAMVDQGASDFHLVSSHYPTFRISGTITPVSNQVIPPDVAQQLIYEVMPEPNRLEWETTHDTDFAYQLAGVARLRCNVLQTKDGIGANFRLIPSKLQTFEDLHLPECLKKLCFLTKGLVLATGPSGCGKSTTLAALIDFINQNRSDHIITIEDPIEYIHPHKRCLVNQRQMHSHTESFKRALRAALREDPDVVLVGEMRDLETIMIALETAETGHLVFGTLHTTTAPGTIDRLINQFSAEQQQQVRVGLAEGLKGVISQTLCKKKGGGRVAAMEILMGSHALSAYIREGKIQQIPMLIQTGRKEGMRALNDALLELVGSGVIEATEAYRRAVTKEDLIKRMGELPNVKGPSGKAWTEEELVKASAEGK